MIEFFAKNYHGAPFEIFGTAHLVALGIVVLLNFLIGYYRADFGPRPRQMIRYSLAAILLVNESLWHWWNWSIGEWTVQTMLPLHLCSVLVFASAIMLLTGSYRIYEFAYFLGIGGATQALLTPDAGVYGFPHFRFFQVILSHGAIVTAAIYMTLVEGYRPYKSSFMRVAIWGNVYMLLVGLVNWAIGSNYLFIAHKPETASLIDMLGPWPWYILNIEIIAFVVFLLLYFPFAWHDWKQTRLVPA